MPAPRSPDARRAARSTVTPRLVLAIALLAGACGTDDAAGEGAGHETSMATIGGSVATTSPTAPPSTASTTPPTTIQPSTEQPTADQSAEEGIPGPAEPEAADGGRGDGSLGCATIERFAAGDVQRAELVETSGLVASTQHPGVLWATNDSGQRSGLYAIDGQGGDLGFFALQRDGVEVSTVDVEDLAIADGVLYLADIGDNARRRPSVAIHLVEEPTPGPDGAASILGTIEVRYPDGPTDAEAVIVDPSRQEALILSKDLDQPSAPTRLYTVALPAMADLGGSVVEATAAGTLDVAALTAASDGFSFSTLFFPGAVTAADLDPQRDLVALRTYGSVWLFRRSPGQSLAQALTATTPCEIGSAAESQGETVAFVTGTGPGTVGYVTISEGQNPPVNVGIVAIDG